MIQPYYHVHICHAELVEASLCLILRVIIISKMTRNERGEEPRYQVWCLDCKRAGFDPVIGDTPSLTGIIYQANRAIWLQHRRQLRHYDIVVVSTVTHRAIASIIGQSTAVKH